MHTNNIKKDYSQAIEKFVKNGGLISQAVNTNKAEFNYCNADTVLQSAERPNSYQNHILRTRAEKQGLKSYKPVALCKSCGTSERSVKTNACLECDRRRARAKMTINESKIIQIGLTLLAQEKTITFTQSGKKYVLKVEEI
ncbi:hypothetical protein [Acinetobacter sp. 251-1]|uniref:hypothetical protein n=1 Tax=Acinetobacter sp. 251-1 TaxID=2746720 RepID=UPI0025757161|nr:hypothetical protein [Acinetobacter sp. 251-1]MDM1760056.1 hypothetical protein [Acinetobacter sp. 251-1]